MATALGCTVVLPRMFDAEDTLALIERHRVEVMAAVPVMLKRIIDLTRRARAPIRHQLAARRGVQRLRARRTAARARSWRSSGRCSTTCTARPRWPGRRSRPRRTCSRRPAPSAAPPPHTRLAILDDDGHPLPPGATGHIFVATRCCSRATPTSSSRARREGDADRRRPRPPRRAGPAVHRLARGRHDRLGRRERLPGPRSRRSCATHPDIGDAVVIGCRGRAVRPAAGRVRGPARRAAT